MDTAEVAPYFGFLVLSRPATESGTEGGASILDRGNMSLAVLEVLVDV